MHKMHDGIEETVLHDRRGARDMVALQTTHSVVEVEKNMNITNLLSRLGGVGAAAGNPLAPEGVSTRIGDVVMARGVANDVVAPADDAGRPHLLAHRAARRERRDIRSA